MISTSPHASGATGVLYVDNPTVLRDGVCTLIERQSDLAVVARAESIGGAARLGVAADVILTDVELPDARYGDAIRELRAILPGASLLVFTNNGDLAEVHTALAAGADGYLLKTAATTDLLTGIRTVAAGAAYLQPALGHNLARAQTPGSIRLSSQENEVLWLLVRGHTNSEIARRCNICLRSAETHRAHVQQKLSCQTRAELVEYARRIGLVTFGNAATK